MICSGVFVEGMTPERAFTESYAYDEGLKPLKRGLPYAVNCANRRITTDWHGHFVSLSTYYFAQKQQLEPLGMHHVSMEFDGAQTLIGSTRIYASARDWARFGQLYLDDGVVNGRCLLPAGWAAFSAAQRWTRRTALAFGPMWSQRATRRRASMVCHRTLISPPA